MLSFNESPFSSDWDIWSCIQSYLKSIQNNPNLDQIHLILGLVMTANLLESCIILLLLYIGSQWSEQSTEAMWFQ